MTSRPSTNANHPTTAEHPFDSRVEADASILTCDNVKYHIIKAILAVASPFFRDMFSLTQPSTAILTSDVASAESKSSPEIEPIPVEEDSQTINAILRFCYPVRDPVLSELPLLQQVLEASIKYQLDFITEIVRERLQTSFVETHPLQVFVIACKLEFEEEAQMAAKRYQSDHGMLKDISGAMKCYIPEMKHISSASYLRLLQFLRQKHDTPQNNLRLTVPNSPLRPNQHIPQTDHFQTMRLSKWKKELNKFESFLQADVVIKSTVDDSLFKVHRMVLRLARAESLLVTQDPLAQAPQSEALPVYILDASWDILAAILRLCYPFPDESVIDILTLRGMLETATKYKVDTLVSAVKQRIAYKWEDIAQECASGAIFRSSLPPYVPDMEDVSAEAYHQLLVKYKPGSKF